MLEGKSQYELDRDVNMLENEMFLKHIGLSRKRDRMDNHSRSITF